MTKFTFYIKNEPLNSFIQLKKKLPCLTENNKNFKSDVRSKASGFKRQLEKYETAFLTSFWGFIVKKFNKVIIALQAVDINVVQVMKYYESLIH